MKTMFASAVAAAMLAACGGGNPPDVVNTPGGGAQNLSFLYFQQCVNPALVAQLALPAGGTP